MSLGGDESYARARRPSPAAFAVGAVSVHLAREENPLAYLGYMYLLEGSTAVIAPRFQAVLQRLSRPVPFVALHADEDTGHVAYLAQQIRGIAEQYADAGPAIDYAFDCFASVYPALVWETALQCAKAEA